MPEVIISASGPQYGLVVNADGSINIGTSGAFKATERYMPVEVDNTDTGSRYYAFEAADSSWYFMATFASGGNRLLPRHRYIAGTSDYISSWANRTTLKFVTPGSVF